MTEIEAGELRPTPTQIAERIVGRFPWTSNVMRDGRLISMRQAVAEAIAGAIEADRGARPQPSVEVVEALQRAQTLIGLLTVRQVIDAGDEAIDAAGLNPWCLNEGLATGDERIRADWLTALTTPEQRVADGYKLVPVEPIPEMIEAGRKASLALQDKMIAAAAPHEPVVLPFDMARMLVEFRAMLDAAPTEGER